MAAHDGIVALLADPRHALVAVDFDGTLAPIVDDPERAFADPAALAALGRVAQHIGTVAIITGRPTRTAVRLGGLDSIPELKDLIVLGQYGVERWDASTGVYQDPALPDEIVAAREELVPQIPDSDIRLEDKGRAVAFHFRGTRTPEAYMSQMTEPISEVAQRYGLVVEPGRLVIEVRAPGMDKGQALRGLIAERGATSVVFAGDDLGDLAAFEAINALQDEGVAGVRVAIESAEQQALAERADVVVAGPAGLAAWLNELADRLTE